MDDFIKTSVIVVELLEAINKCFYQINLFAILSCQSKKECGKIETEKHCLLTILEVKLTSDKPAKPIEGFQVKL